MKKNILVVDDDLEICETLTQALQHQGTFNVLNSHNGREAMESLAGNAVDLVVTDLQMPEMDGFSLIAYLSRHYPGLPLIIMTAYHSDDVEARLRQQGISTYLRKPFAPADLMERIFDLLNARDKGVLKGISLAPFLQLLEMERKTCTLTVTHGDQSGWLTMVYGSLVDAQVGQLRGEAAAMVIIGWDSDVRIELENICRNKSRTISRELRFIIMESLRLVDEQRLPDVDEAVPFDETTVDLELQPSANRDQDQMIELSEERCERVGQLLEDLGDIRGVQGAAVVDAQGNIVVQALIDRAVDVPDIVETFREYIPPPNLFPKSHFNETVFRLSDQVVFVLSAGREDSGGFHLMVLLQEESAEGLLKLRLRRLMPKLMVYLFSLESVFPASQTPPEVVSEV